MQQMTLVLGIGLSCLASHASQGRESRPGGAPGDDDELMKLLALLRDRKANAEPQMRFDDGRK